MDYWDKIGTYKILILLVTPFVIYFAADFSMGYMAEYSKKGLCYSTNSVLSEQELRERTIRNWLKAEVKDARNSDSSMLKTFLSPNYMTFEKVVDAVRLKSFDSLELASPYQLVEIDDVDKVSSDFFKKDFSFIIKRGQKDYIDYIHITPIKSLDNILNGKNIRGYFNLNSFEKASGYGSNFFKINKYMIDIGQSRIALIYPKIELLENSYLSGFYRKIEFIKSSYEHHLVISNCGDVLHRDVPSATSYGDETVYEFTLQGENK
jgi:hypothetical protein